MKKATLVLIELFCIIMLTAGCSRNPKKKHLDTILKTTMSNFLNAPDHIDTSKIKFTVLDVIYFDDKKNYQCEFKVHLKNPTTDTTGTMTATISRDFRNVIRKN